MRIRKANELLLLNLLVLGLVVVILSSPSNVLRIVLGLPFLLLFPGYALMAVLFPKREAMSGIEWAALSFGMSIAAVPIIGLILNYTQWGVRLEPTLYSIACFVFIMSVIPWLRRKRLVERKR